MYGYGSVEFEAFFFPFPVDNQRVLTEPLLYTGYASKYTFKIPFIGYNNTIINELQGVILKARRNQRANGVTTEAWPDERQNQQKSDQ